MKPKFRVWNKKTESFIDYGDLMLDLKNAKVYAGDVGIPEYTIDVTEQVVLMQYTGLKDMNGKEIYEGDIVRLTEKTINGGIDTHTCKVFQSKSGAWRLEGRPDFSREYTTKRELYSVRNRVEIIGNVWENPELLEVEE